jgi:uncharacterized membrane protein
MTLTPILLTLHFLFNALFLGSTAACLAVRGAARHGDVTQRVHAARAARAIASRVQLPGFLGALATGLALVFMGTSYRFGTPGQHWLDAKLALVLLAGLLAHVDNMRATRAARAHDADAASAIAMQSGLSALTFILLLATLALAVFRPF